MLRSVKQLTKKELKGKRVLLRLDLNVPMEGEIVTDDHRIKRSLKTINYLKERGAKVIVISHMGKSDDSLKPVVGYLGKLFNVGFVPNIEALGDGTAVPEGGVVVVENLRQNKGEEANSPAFAKQLAARGDVYVNEAFSASHRKHASIVGLPKLLPAYAGFLLIEEVEGLSKAFKPKHPFLFILGGAKFSTKVPLIKKFLKTADSVFLGGALVHIIFKLKKYQIGKSLVDKSIPGLAALAKNKKLLTPVDVVVENGNGYYVKAPNAVGKDDVIVDAGPESVELINKQINQAKFVLWNGPLGNFEKGYDKATLEIAKAITSSKAYSIIGGGDTISALSRLDVLDQFNFVSTGGGAMLDFLAAGTLPGIEALKKPLAKKRK